jgi:hypothetical protein
MRKLTTKLLFAIISVAFALVALGTTTFAWFTLSDTATVSTFDAQITAGEGIEISLDGTNYYTTIPATVIQNKITQLNVELKDVTSKNGKQLFYFNSDEAINYTSLGTAKKPYIEFDLSFRSPSATGVILEEYKFTSKHVVGDQEVEGISWTADVSFTNSFGAPVTAGTPATYYAHAALRMSLTPVINESSEGTAVVYQAPDDSAAEVKTNKALYQPTGDTVSPIQNGMVDYYNTKNSDNPLDLTNVTLANALTEPSDSNLITLAANTPQKVRVRIWIEGWDPDTFNAILNAKINVKMVFKSNAAE